mgnify:CR=1 FL=1
MKHASVLDARGRRLSPCSADKASRLVSSGRAELVSDDPLVVRLGYAVDLPEARSKNGQFKGRHVLVHICCAPCATYTVRRLRERGFEVTGLWFNPNIHPYSEHERRRETLARYAEETGLPIIWEPGYEMPAFLQAVVGHEQYGERCRICYRLRLARTADVASEHGFDAITTTLLISPYQDQAAIRRIGEKLAGERGVAFYFENFRRGFAEHYRLSKEHNLYMQRYCGCIYSEWEANDRQASTHPRV